MSSLPSVSGREAIRAFERAGFSETRTSGSHCILHKEGHIYHLSVPIHKSLKKGTLRSLINDAGLTVEEFIRLL